CIRPASGSVTRADAARHHVRFRIRVPAVEWTEVLVRLSIATVLCALIGLEREFRGHPAGIRTHAVVGIGAALFTIAGAYGLGDLKPDADPTRVAAQIASGVGFLGAGVILRHGLDVRGLTTAA